MNDGITTGVSNGMNSGRSGDGKEVAAGGGKDSADSVRNGVLPNDERRGQIDIDEIHTEIQTDSQTDLVERAERYSGRQPTPSPVNASKKTTTKRLSKNTTTKNSNSNSKIDSDTVAIDEKSVCDWLQKNPDLLHRRPELLSHLTLSHVDNAEVSSLIERQVDRLRTELRTLQTHFDTVVESARLSEQQQTRVHRLAHSLVAATERKQVVSAVGSALKDDFNIDQVVVRLGSDVEDEAVEAYGMLRDRVAQGRSFCDDRLPERSMQWLFDDARDRVASCAVVPIRANEEVIGIIGLADADKNRFGRDMGTVYLDQLGELIGAAIARL